MKLLCVDTPNSCKYSDGTPSPNNSPDPKVGSTYTAYDEYRNKDGVHYFLVGFPGDTVYHNSLFATLPDDTADDMQEEEHEAIVNLETVRV